MLIANFMRFRRKRLKKQTHIDNFSLKKNPNEFIGKKQEKPKIIEHEKFHPFPVSC